jgi:hypothetical protein
MGASWHRNRDIDVFGNLRLVATDKLSEHRANTGLLLQPGNSPFADAMRPGTGRYGGEEIIGAQRVPVTGQQP